MFGIRSFFEKATKKRKKKVPAHPAHPAQSNTKKKAGAQCAGPV